MKYVIATTAEGVNEILLLDNGLAFTKSHKRTEYGLQCLDDDFADQIENAGVTDEYFLDQIADTLDGCFPLNFLELAELE